MARILWVSERELSEDERKDLIRIYGENVEIINERVDFTRAFEVSETAKKHKCDIVACTYADSILGLFDLYYYCKSGNRSKFKVIRLRADNHPVLMWNDKEDVKFEMIPSLWEEVRNIEVVTVTL